jgi:hypothetical protein
MPDPFNVKGEREHREINKIDHDTTIIKLPLQEHNDPRLDHPCSSVLKIFTKKMKEKGS